MRFDINRRRVAAALLSTATLGGGLLAAGPATAAATHTVAVQSNPGVANLVEYIDCVGPNNEEYYDSAAASSSGRATFTGVPDGYTCTGGESRDNNVFQSYDWNTQSDPQVITGDSQTLVFTGTADTSFRPTGYSTIAGSLAVAQTVTAVPGPMANGAFNPSTLTYDWYRVDYTGGYPVYTPIQNSNPQHNSSHYTLTEADYGHQIEVDIEGRNSDNTASGYTFTAVSSPVGRLGTPAPRRPVIRGKAIVGHRLGSLGGTPPAGSSVSGYQWYYEKVVKTSKGKKVVFVKIRGAHHSVYRLTKRDKGKLIVLAITYTRPSYNPTVLMSKPKRVH